MTFIALTLCTLLLAAQGAKVGKVESTYDKHADFSAFHTYRWTPGYNSYRPDAHKMIVAAIEEEMTKLGFSQVDSNADVTIAYYTVTSDEVDLDALEELQDEGKRTQAPTRILGRLVIMMRRPDAADRLWTASMREHLDPHATRLEASIRQIVAKLFGSYPGRESREHR